MSRDTPRDHGEGIAPGLHIVSTPIGAARDITLRALDILAGADVLAAEDTRTLRRLLSLHGIALGGRRILAVHEHNERTIVPLVLAELAAGRSVAYAAEAGTPLISDPGFVLARAAAQAGHRVLAAPGPSALLAALVVSGLPADRFLFAGFPPAAPPARRRFLEGLAGLEATVVLFESPRRVRATLADLAQSFGETRVMALCRELTKRHETILRGTIAEVRGSLGEGDPRGEIVLVLDRAGPARPDTDDAALRERVASLLTTMSVRETVTRLAQDRTASRRELYRIALEIRGEGAVGGADPGVESDAEARDRMTRAGDGGGSGGDAG